MKAKRQLLLIALPAALVLMAMVVLISRQHVQLYNVTVLPTLGDSVTWVDAINDYGQVVGTSFVTDKFHIFLWDRENGMQDLGPAGIGRLDINNAGQITGTVIDPNGNKQAFFWDPNNGRQMLGTLGSDESVASGLNNRGQVVGTLYSASRGPPGTRQKIGKAFIWDESAGMRELFPDERRESSASAINDAGQIIGSMATYESPVYPVPFFWDSNDPVGAPPLQFPEDYPGGRDLNNNGYVLGRTQHLDKDEQWVFLWTKEPGIEGIKYLFSFERLDGYNTLELNDANHVVYGQVQTSAFERFSKKHFPPYVQFYLRDPKRGTIILDKQVPREMGALVYFKDINNQGSIVGGIGLKDLGYGVPLLLEPIPERWNK